VQIADGGAIGKWFAVATVFAVAATIGPASAADLVLQQRHAAETQSGSVHGRLIRPESSIERPEDKGKRAHTPLRVIVPDHPIEPPRPPRAGQGK
jgi:hypothetical protein